MRIALRPSGGRGDYELAGSYNGISASELLGKNILFQITPNFIVDGKARANKLSGKTRIRPENGKHAYVILGSILLLPQPRRELIKTSHQLTELITGQYTLAGIDVEILSQDRDNVIFAPTNLWAKNQGGILKIDFSERMAVISSIWSEAASKSSLLSNRITEHYKAVISSDHFAMQTSALSIQKVMNTEKDVIPLILREFNLSDPIDYSLSGITENATDFETEDYTTSPENSFRERIRKWRMQTIRGPGARDFSLQVRKAYDYRCLFSGERFPKIEPLYSAGVDGAHILPWSIHQLNSVVNGVCLCKQCHWAFDNGLLKLDFKPETNDYFLSIPKEIEIIAIKQNFELDLFKRNLGIIDKSRLPKNYSLWPSPKYINELNMVIP
jgi:HNH endonuclease